VSTTQRGHVSIVVLSHFWHESLAILTQSRQEASEKNEHHGRTASRAVLPALARFVALWDETLKHSTESFGMLFPVKNVMAHTSQPGRRIDGNMQRSRDVAD